MNCPVCNQTNRATAHFCAYCRAPLFLQNKYRVVRLLGRGGYGAVYQAEQLHFGGVPCAIKELALDPNATPQQAQQSAAQFQFEASVLAKLNHPGLPRVTDFFNEGKRFYLAMDYIEGDTLEERLARFGVPLPESQVTRWAEELCNVLDYLHTRQPNPVIHRDVKPSNIKITPEGKTMLIDFGIAKLLVAGSGTVTAARAVSPPYAPMEQYGTGTDARSDVYALGVTMYQLLTNQLPPEAPDRATQDVVPPHQWNGALSANAETVIVKAMAEKPADRFQSAYDMKQALLSLMLPQQAHLPVSQHVLPVPQPAAYAGVPVQSTPRTGTGGWVGAAIALFTLAVGVFGFGILEYQRQQTQATAAEEARASATAVAVAEQATVTAQARVKATTVAVAAQATATIQAQATGTARSKSTLQRRGTTPWISRIIVNAAYTWVGTGIIINRGQNVLISASGTWSHGTEGDGKPHSGPDGFGKYDPDAILPQTKVGTLIGRIGIGKPFQIGTEKYFLVDDNGELLLSMNDVVGQFENNDGYVSVVITIQ